MHAHIICRTEQILTNCRCFNSEKPDFKQFCSTKLSEVIVLSVARQFFTNVHFEDFNANISLLSRLEAILKTKERRPYKLQCVTVY